VDGLVTSLVAVGGTLAGSGLTYLFGWFTARRAERVTRAERLRQDRIAAITTFAGAITGLRQAVITLWFARRNGPAPDEQTEADKRGAAADHARFTVRLLLDDPEALRLADDAFESITAIGGAADLTELKSHEERNQAGLNAFIEAAGRYVR
jgi:hypothetical protein